ncbi:hypothetical protein C8R47DRAFT_1272511 [Mycena vitilis]|nr:hypothetical protein C8R47DRAFT_1272511 [Mycena vitilis]
MSPDCASDSELDFIQQYAPPVRRDGFLFHGHDFYVQLSGYRLRRADATRLHSLLTYTAPPPVLTKAGKPAKTKEAAKRALLGAFGSKKTLAAPSKVLNLEKEMGKEYKEANKLVKAKYVEEQKEDKKKEEEKRNMRKRERESAIENFLQEDSSRPVKKGKTQAIKGAEN